MGKYTFRPDWMVTRTHEGQERTLIGPKALAEFSPKLLGLGDLTVKAKELEVICAFLDLSGFTNFCKQVDPYLVIPKFLNDLMNFIFNKIMEETINETHDGAFTFYHPLPFFLKFMGDGLMVLWDTEGMTELSIANILFSMRNLCANYAKEFHPKCKARYVDTPQRLRVGLARGHAYSIGNGDDYVGACINIAARLQKFGGFVAAKRGIGLDEAQIDHALTKVVNIRGIGARELVYIFKTDFESLSAEEQALFEEP
jgi:class 3 adenylate cyclase